MKKVIYILLVMSTLAGCGKGQKETTDTCVPKTETLLSDTLIDLIEEIMHDTLAVVSTYEPVIVDLQILEVKVENAKFSADSLVEIGKFTEAADAYRVYNQDKANFEKVTRIVNGGVNGLPHRMGLFLNAMKVLEHHHSQTNTDE